MVEAVSALGRISADPRRGLTLTDLGVVGQVTLKADLAGAAVAEAVATAVGTAVPAPLTAVFDGARGAVWMAPDELLLLAPLAEAPVMAETLERQLEARHALVADMSHARSLIRLTGSAAPEVLAKGAPVDLREAAFPVGRARRTHLAEIAVGLWHRAPEVWEIACFRSYSRHLWAWLLASGSEGAELDPS